MAKVTLFRPPSYVIYEIFDFTVDSYWFYHKILLVFLSTKTPFLYTINITNGF
jgi:hypothetical protein